LPERPCHPKGPVARKALSPERPCRLKDRAAQETEERREALDRSIRALARRDHSAASLRAKLDRSGLSGEAQTEALETLARAGYLDDARFARDRAEELAARGYGDDWIRAYLQAQGVAAAMVADALTGLEPEAERAARQWTKLSGGVRAARTLARRGFAEDTLEALLAGSVAHDPPTGVG
jgi:regulatory protein